MNETFEEFLSSIHMDLFPQTLDDDLPDAFNDWLSEIDVEDLVGYGELYGKSRFLDGQQKILGEQLEKLS